MTFTNINTHGDSPNNAFEALCNQLFERWVRATYHSQTRRFATVNGAGGDGGVEAYAELQNGSAVGLQAKWFPGALEDSQINQIRKSVTMALTVRPHIRRYIVCVPRDFGSIKIGAGGRSIKKSEEDRVAELVTELQGTHSGVAVEFWTEHVLRGQLQQAGNEGIFRFWFSKSELSQELVEQQFLSAKAGWLRERYLPDLHCQGVIQHNIDKALFTSAFRAEQIGRIAENIADISKATHLIALFIARADATASLIAELQALTTDFEKHRYRLEQVVAALRAGNDVPQISELGEVEIWPIRSQIEEGQFSNRVRGVSEQLIDLLETVHRLHLPSHALQVVADYQPHHLIILGQPGTGKTHGVVRAVEQRLDAHLPALIIQARRAPAATWKAVLEYAIDGVGDWSLHEILTALEAMASRADVRRTQTADPQALIQEEPTHVLICVDGVDEAPEPALWAERVGEMQNWLRTYPRIRVVFTSRSYPPFNMNPYELECGDGANRRLDLPREGDVPLPELAKKYLEYHKIDYASVPWLPEAFQDALSVRLFALERQGQSLSSIAESVSVSLLDLLKNKIQQLENEFSQNFRPSWTNGQHLAHHGLNSVIKALLAQSEMDHDELCQLLIAGSKGRIDLNLASRMLEGFKQHGLIQQWSEPAASRLAPPTKRVAFTFQQPLVDFFIAFEATEQIIATKTKRIPPALAEHEEWNAFYLTAMALANDANILVGENGYWSGDFNEQDLQALKYAALANSGGALIRRHVPQAATDFWKGAEWRNLVLREFILANAARLDGDLVIPIIHDTLCGFSSVFERDLFWSGPVYGEQDKEENIASLLSTHCLHSYQPAAGLPLVFAWSLATVDNSYREYARQQLTHWASSDLGRFVELLDLVFFRGDPQMQEDLAAVMLGASSLETQASEGGKALVDWILTAVFSPDAIRELQNSMVRACARAAVERAILLGNCTDTEAQAARPPYATYDALLPLKFPAEDSDIGNRGERFPIEHDLAWYVLEKSYRNFLDLPTMGKSRKLAQGYELLAVYEKHHGFEIGPDNFAMSAALAYIESLGYNREDGPGYTQATHGSLSKISTLEEKYTWLAVHQLQGYLADRLPYERYGTMHKRVPHYGLFLDIINPATELPGKQVCPVEWYVPVEISPRLPEGEPQDVVARVKAWVDREDEPDFHTWLTLPDFRPAGTATEIPGRKWTPLYLQLRLPEPTGNAATVLEIGCAWVPQAHWDTMLSQGDNEIENTIKRNQHDFDDIDGWLATPAAASYASVKDVVQSQHTDEEEATIGLYGSEDQEWTWNKTVTKVLEHSVEQGEQEYLVPAKIVRQHLGISSTNRQSFTNQAGTPLACYQEIRKGYEATQEMLVLDRAAFEAAGLLHQLKPVWLVSQFQNTTTEFTKEYENGHAQNFRMWLVWEDDGQIQSRLIYTNWFKSQQEGYNYEKEDEVAAI